MARNQNSFIKKQKAERKRKKRQEKIQKKIDRKNKETDGSLDNMMAYLDDDGNIIPQSQQIEEEEESNKLSTNINKNEKRNS